MDDFKRILGVLNNGGVEEQFTVENIWLKGKVFWTTYHISSRGLG